MCLCNPALLLNFLPFMKGNRAEEKLFHKILHFSLQKWVREREREGERERMWEWKDWVAYKWRGKKEKWLHCRLLHSFLHLRQFFFSSPRSSRIRLPFRTPTHTHNVCQCSREKREAKQRTVGEEEIKRRLDEGNLLIFHETWCNNLFLLRSVRLPPAEMGHSRQK